IHAVGPIYGTANDADLLASAYRRSLEVTLEYPIKTIAFPAISTGVFSYPLPEAASIALNTVCEFARAHTQIERIQFVLFMQNALSAFSIVLRDVIEQNTDIEAVE